jgi:hypothetical protein
VSEIARPVPEAAFCTILARNYLAQARVLCRSLRARHPGVPVYALVVDDPAGYFDPAREDFTCLSLADLELPDPRGLAFRYGVVELCTAVKPRLLACLFARGHRKLVYLDPDVRVYASLDALLARLDTAQALVTPHLTERADAGAGRGELDVLLCGVYNLGFLGLAASPSVDAFLSWWWDRCRERCIVDLASGIFVDQRWMDLLPAMLDRVHVVRDKSCNVARWNLAQRRLSGTSEVPLVDGEPLAFLHFSEFDPRRPTRFFWAADGAPAPEEEPLRTLASRYADELQAAGWEDTHRWPYGHGFLSDGHPIDVSLRALYRRVGRDDFGDPFDAGESGRFLAWAVSPAGTGTANGSGRGSLWLRTFQAGARVQGVLPPGRIARWGARALLRLARMARAAPEDDGPRADLAPLAAEILSLRRDVREAFAGARGVNRLPFLLWLASRGTREHHLKPSWCARWIADTADDPCLVPLLLAGYDASPEARRRFPRAFVEEHDADAYLAFVLEHPREAGVAPDQLEAVRQLFADRPGQKIAAIYHSRPDVARAFPRALSDPDDDAFLAWLRYSGRREYDIPEDWVLWFARSRRQHACLRLHAAWRERPDWRSVHSGAFTASGGRAFLEWLRASGPPELARLASGLDALCPLEGEEETLPDSQLGVMIAGLLRTESGMGELARSTARSLAAVGCPVSLVLHGSAPQRQTSDGPAVATAGEARPFAILHRNAADPAAARARRAFGETVAIGYCTWELETPPRAWPQTARAFDEVWTLSHFSARALAPTSPVPVQVMWPAIPEMAEVTQVVPGAETGRALLPADDAFTVLFVFDLWSRMERKNPLGLIDAFDRAFCGDAGARLVIKAGGARQHPDELRRLREAAAGRRVLILEDDLARDEVLALMRACDVYASLHRAEGFGLTIAEAMALGKPVVATHYSGNTDFMTPWNSFPVPYRLVELPADDHVYPRGSAWAEPDLDAAAGLFREIRRDPQRAHAVAERGRGDVRARLSAEASGRRMLTRLRTLARERGLHS